jgi:hypothetical protein
MEYACIFIWISRAFGSVLDVSVICFSDCSFGDCCQDGQWVTLVLRAVGGEEFDRFVEVSQSCRLLAQMMREQL